MGMLGTRCGNYVLTELLGRGGMGAVYRAAHPKIGRQVAVKVLDKQLGEEAEHSKRFADEAAMLARMGHPNIVEIYDFGQLPNGQFYFVMEHLRGCELKPLMRHRGKMSAEEVAPYLEQICAGLEAAHAKGIVHRDVKPANVFVLTGASVRIKLLDFGISKNTDKAMGPTKPGMMMGTPTYMAPEQVKGSDPVRPAADIYSVGVMLYEMLAGRPPFRAEAVFDLLAMHLRDEPPPLAELAADVPAQIVALVMRCLAKHPRARPVSARQLWDLFAEALDAADLSMVLRHQDASLIDELAKQQQAAHPEPQEPPKQEGTPTTAPAPAGRTTAPAPAPSPRSAVDTEDVPPASPPAAGDGGRLEDGEDAREVQDKDALIDELLAQMRRKGDFPAIAKSIQEIQRHASITGIASARTLASSIQKDYALSTKLLRVVNSAYYERNGGRISSVARAVVMLGFEHVRDTAIGLTVFPRVRGREEAQQAVDSTVNALMSGVLATKIAASQNIKRVEDAFACGLFRTLGRQLVLFYLPERHAKILALVEARGIHEEAAARRELGVGYDELGNAIAKRWRLADVICDSTRPYDPESAPMPRNDAERLRATAALANEVCSTLSETPPEQHEEAMEQLLARYASKLRIQPARLEKLVETSVQGVREQFGDLVDFELADSTLFRRLLQVERPAEAQPAPQPEPGARPINGQAALGAELGPRPELRLEQGIREVERALRQNQGVEAVLRSAMQTAHEGLDLRRVAFMAYTARGDLEIRAVLGDGDRQLKGTIVEVDQRGDDPFSAAVVYRKDRLVAAGNGEMPQWCRDGGANADSSPGSARDAAMHYLYPIEVFMKPAGLLYANGRRLGGPLLPYLDRLRNYIAAAMRGC